MEACLRARPEDPRAWRDYLAMLQTLGEQEAFDAMMARVPRSAESEPEIWMFRGQAKERAGDAKAAAQDYRKALELNPNLTNAHYRLYMIEERQGLRDSAAVHRKRWQELRDARTRLPDASREYQAAMVAVSTTEAGPPAIARPARLRPARGRRLRRARAGPARRRRSIRSCKCHELPGLACGSQWSVVSEKKWSVVSGQKVSGQ